MPTSLEPIRTRQENKSFLAWTTPVGLLVINFAAFLLCMFGSPWSDAPLAALAITVLSAIPLAALAYLTVRIYRRGSALRQELAGERNRVLQARSRQALEQWYSGMRQERESAALLQRGLAAPEFASSDLPAAWPGPADPSLLGATEKYVKQRYVASEDLHLDALQKFLSELALDRLEPLQRDHVSAFGWGLIGTVSGLGAQVFLAQLIGESVLDKTFLTGVVLKASCTLVGITVAWYARDVRWRLLEEYDRLVALLIEFASSRMAPLFAEVRAERADLAEVLRGVVEELNRTVRGIEGSLQKALHRAVEDASQALGDKLKQTFAGEIATAINEQITKPFRHEVERLKTEIARASDAIAQNVRGLHEGTRGFKEEVKKTVEASFGIGDRLLEARHVLGALTHEFERIVAQAEAVARTLGASQDAVIRELERLRSQDNHHLQNDLALAEAVKQAEALLAERQYLDSRLSDVAEMLRTLDGHRGRRN